MSVNETKNDNKIINNPFYWGMNPRFWATPSVFIKDIYLMKTYDENLPEYYNYHDNPISVVKILGVITAKDINSKLISYTVDDGSESIECIFFKKDMNEDKINENQFQYQLFDTITIIGKISEFRNQRKLHINKIKKETDLNAELFFWLDVINQKKKYKKQFILSEETINEIDSYYKEEKKKWTNKEEFYKELFGNFDTPRKKKKVENKLIITDEVTLKLKIMKYLYQSDSLNFKFTELKQNEELKNIAIEIIKQKNEFLITEEGITMIFAKVINLLVKDGVMFQSDEENDIYELIHYKYNLGPAIHEHIKKYITNKKCESVEYKKIIVSLANSKAFKYATEKTINKSLNFLVEQNKIEKIVNTENQVSYTLCKSTANMESN